MSLPYYQGGREKSWKGSIIIKETRRVKHWEEFFNQHKLSLLPRRERKILEKVYYYQGDQMCETLGGIFQPTQALLFPPW